MLEPAGTADAFETIEAAEVTDANDARADFDARFDLARERLLRIAGSLVGAEEADDVVHDSYLLGWQRYDQLREASAFESWLTRIVVNQCFGRHRRIRRLRELLPALLPSKTAGPDLGLRDLIERLPPRERTVLVLILRARLRPRGDRRHARPDAHERADDHRPHPEAPVPRLARGGGPGPMSRCRQTDELLQAAFANEGLTRAQTTHVSECTVCARKLAAARRFDLELHRAANVMADAESDLDLRQSASRTRGGTTMKQLSVMAAIAAVVLLAASAYVGGSWIGSMVDLDFDHSGPTLLDGTADDEAGRPRAAAIEAARAEAQARRAAMEASRAAAERRALEEVWVDATCGDWHGLSAEQQFHVAEEFVVGLREEVRTAEQLDAQTTFPEIAVAAQATLSDVCEGSEPMERLADVVDELYGSD
ncbi:MAG TPA: sigma factor [Candidatus Limnocylindrales bacterium]|nr:sigma factor [Candidatus Limnocylindrales bacterium]